MPIAADKGVVVSGQVVSGLIEELVTRTSYDELAQEVGTDRLQFWEQTTEECAENDVWDLIGFIYKRGFFDLLPAHGIGGMTYNIGAPFDLIAPPVGFEQDPPVVPLVKAPRKIAGFSVDFPLGLPASVLAANSKWIEFYANRGFDVLTYKTVRTRYRHVHPWPNWVFIKHPFELIEPFSQPAIGVRDYWPEHKGGVSMANSFGIPSLKPDWWMDDVRRAREVVREGHQVLIVSVVASVQESPEAIAEDFVEAAVLAKQAGADIVEANYSCPNTPGDPAGEVYKSPKISAYVSKALKDALENTPLFVKIGYLAEEELHKFVESNAKFIDGIVAINTISAEVKDEQGRQVFPGAGRNTAGVSGWAIKARGQEVARNLVKERSRLAKAGEKNLAILGLGGALTPNDCREYLDIGVDAVETCTGAFLNPNLGLELRLEESVLREHRSRLMFEWEVFRTFINEVVKHPTKPSRLMIDRMARRVGVYQGL